MILSNTMAASEVQKKAKYNQIRQPGDRLFSPKPISIFLCASAVGLGLVHGLAQAATIEVNSNLDDGNACTLREAVASINQGGLSEDCQNSSSNDFGVNDSITFNASLTGANSTITLEEAQLSFSSVTVLVNAGDSGITVQTDDPIRILAVIDSTVTLNNMTLTGGAIDGNGGGLYANNASVTLNNSTVMGNSVSGSNNDGGGLYANNSSIMLSNSSVSGNVVNGDGGGLSANESTIILSNSTVSGNSAAGGDSDGGGVFATNNSTIELNDSTVSDNLAMGNDGDGGGLFAFPDSIIRLTNSTVSGNSANDSGGGVFAASSSTIELNNSTVSGNSAAVSGGGLLAAGSTINLNNSTVADNDASSGGGGLNVTTSSTITLNFSTVAENSAVSGGGLRVLSGSSAELRYSTLSANVATRFDGGAMEVLGGSSVTLTNSTVSGNVGRFGGGFRADGSTVRLNNSTMSDNTSNASFSGGAFIGFSNATLVLENSIVANSIGGNDIALGGGADVDSDSASIIEQGGFGARAGDPALLPLANNGRATQTHALSVNSIARNSSTGVCPELDQRGILRDTSGNDGVCDVGAVEFDASLIGDVFVIPLGNGRSAVVPL